MVRLVVINMCVRVCMHVCVCMNVYCVCMHAHICVYACECVCMHAHMCVYVYVYVCVWACMNVYMHVCAGICVCMCVHGCVYMRQCVHYLYSIFILSTLQNSPLSRLRAIVWSEQRLGAKFLAYRLPMQQSCGLSRGPMVT